MTDKCMECMLLEQGWQYRKISRRLAKWVCMASQARKVLQWVRHSEDVDKELAMHEAEAGLTSAGPLSSAPKLLLESTDMDSRASHSASQSHLTSDKAIRNDAADVTNFVRPVLPKHAVEPTSGFPSRSPWPGNHLEPDAVHLPQHATIHTPDQLKLHGEQPDDLLADPAELQQGVSHPEPSSPAAAQSPTAGDACLGRPDRPSMRAQDAVDRKSTSEHASQQRVAWHTILARRNRPQLLLPAACTFFQIWSGGLSLSHPAAHQTVPRQEYLHELTQVPHAYTLRLQAL